MFKLELSCNPVDVLIVMCIDYNDDVKVVREAYNNVGYVALGLAQLGYKPADHIRKYIANRRHNEPIYNDVDYDFVNAGLTNLMCLSMPMDVDIDKWLKRKTTRDLMSDLGDEEYADYINTLGIDKILCKKMETEKRWRDETAERVNQYHSNDGRTTKTSHTRPTKYHMSGNPRKPRNDKGKPRGQYKKRINKKAPAN